jgi:tetratricopeptide (TPR) repeat protein
MSVPRPPRIQHCTSHAYRFFGRAGELALLDEALASDAASVVAFVGAGGQGKTAIVQHWLEQFQESRALLDGLFLWSFYRGKDSDLCLRELYAYAEGQDRSAELSATFCVDHLVPRLRRERWALVLDGAEVVQHESGPFAGRFLHAELGRLVEELASEPMPGVLVLTTRFAIPGLANRKHARCVSLAALDVESARELLRTLGVQGRDEELHQAAAACGQHAKAVELLATYLTRFHQGRVERWRGVFPEQGERDDESRVARVLLAFQAELPQATQDILALATSFREPPTEPRLLEYLSSSPVAALLHEHWGRGYGPLAEHADSSLQVELDDLVRLRLLERVAGAGQNTDPAAPVIDAHPLVRRAFEHVLGPVGRRQSALSRAGFLRGRPDRRRPESLDEARETVELFHAHCDAGLWNEADGGFVALENPKHRFLAPAFERDLLLRFFPHGDWRQPPLWPGFGRYRSLAICFELLGDYEAALEAYRGTDAPLRGDALIALGRLEPLLQQASVTQPWQTLWGAYRAHALCLAGRTEEALALAASLVPVDIYEWVHVFECWLRCGKLGQVDVQSVLYRPPFASEHAWAELARRRLQADYQRLTGEAPLSLQATLRELIDAYDRGGLAFERTLTRLSLGRLVFVQQLFAEASEVCEATLALARRHGLRVLEVDAVALSADIAWEQRDRGKAAALRAEAARLRAAIGYHGPGRP